MDLFLSGSPTALAAMKVLDYLPMEAWMPVGPPYKPMPPMHSWFWREGFVTQSAETIAGWHRDCLHRKSNLLLNLSPDTTGLLPEQTVQTMKQVAKLIYK